MSCHLEAITAEDISDHIIFSPIEYRWIRGEDLTNVDNYIRLANVSAPGGTLLELLITGRPLLMALDVALCRLTRAARLEHSQSVAGTSLAALPHSLMNALKT